MIQSSLQGFHFIWDSLQFLGYLKPLSASPFKYYLHNVDGLCASCLPCFQSSLGFSVFICFLFDVVTGLQKSDSDLFSLFSLLWVKMCHECCFKSYLISFHFSVICEWKCVISAVSSLTYCIYIREFSNFKISPLFKGSADMISVHWFTVNQFLFEATLFRN